MTAVDIRIEAPMSIVADYSGGNADDGGMGERDRPAPSSSSIATTGVSRPLPRLVLLDALLPATSPSPNDDDEGGDGIGEAEEEAAGIASRDALFAAVPVGPVDSSDDPYLLTLRRAKPHPPPLISPSCDASPHLSIRPTCNDFHMLDLPASVASDTFRKAGKGGSRVVWATLESDLADPTDPASYSLLRSSDETGGQPQSQSTPLSLPELWKQKRISFALKTLRWTREFEPLMYEKNEGEAMALERMSSSPRIADIYGYCGMSTAGMYLGGKDLARFAKHYPVFAEKTVDRESGGRTKKMVPAHPGKALVVALRLARAVADLHSDRAALDGSGGDGDGDEHNDYDGGSGGGGGSEKQATAAAPVLTIIHRDMDAANVLLSHVKPPKVYLDDFNYGYILRRSPAAAGSNFTMGEEKEDMCSYRNEYVCGEDSRRINNRAPEECLPADRARRPLTRAVDLYGLGSIYFYLLTSGRYRPYGLNPKAAANANGGGRPSSDRVWDDPEWYRSNVVDRDVRPVLPPEVEESDNEAVMELREVTRDLMSYEPEDRPEAHVVARRLEAAVERYVKAGGGPVPAEA